jgi:hypothetical protein
MSSHRISNEQIQKDLIVLDKLCAKDGVKD